MRLILLISFIGISVSGCATITRGTTNQVQLVSEPESAHARTSMGQTCQTPCTLNVSRKDEFSVTFEKEGFASQTIEVKTQVAGAGAAGFAGNILIGGIVGMGTDAITGAALEHVPNPVRADLLPLEKKQPAGKPARVRRRSNSGA